MVVAGAIMAVIMVVEVKEGRDNQLSKHYLQYKSNVQSVFDCNIHLIMDTNNYGNLSPIRYRHIYLKSNFDSDTQEYTNSNICIGCYSNLKHNYLCRLSL